MAIETHQSPPIRTLDLQRIWKRASMEPSTEYPRRDAIPAAPYSMRAPSPPPIVIPQPDIHHTIGPLRIVPTYEKVDPASLSPDDLKIITQSHQEQLATDSSVTWTYESRRLAQPVLDFLYLGPSNVVRDRKWLRDNGITMLLAARNTRMAGVNLLAVDKVAQELGIQAEYVDVSSNYDLIRAFPSAIRAINDHMLDVFRGQRISTMDMGMGGGEMAIHNETFRRGKVLVFCETGNDRSVSIVVAYLMSIFGMSLIEACQFVHYKRFSICMTDELRQVLKSYEIILSAQRTVHRHELDSKSNQANGNFVKTSKMKRCIEETMDEEMEGTNEVPTMDEDRFLGRQTFVPFIDNNTDFEARQSSYV